MTRPRILLLHAFPFDGSMWDGVRARLEEAGWEADAPDLPGEGTIADWAAGLLAGDDRIVPVGSSLGGYTAFALWRRAPERIAGLVLAGTRPGADTEEVRESRDKTAAYLREEGMPGLWPGLAPRLFAAGTPPEVVARAEAIALAQPVDRLVGHVLAMRDRPDSTPLLPEIDVPVLVAAGAEDQIVPLPEARAFAEQLPNAELVRLDGTGHLAAFEWPHELARRILRFLEDLE